MGTVYSTEQGRLCPDCEQAINACTCKKNKSFTAQETIKISRETKGRKGKGVTLIEGLGGTEAELKALAKTIKQKCNSGGSVKNGIIEIQGDHRNIIKTFLEQKSYQVKLSGD